MKIAVAGGTGLVGSRVVTRLHERGDDVVVLSRATGVDLTTGAGLSPVLDGVDVVIDVTSPGSANPAETVAFFRSVAKNLQHAGSMAGVRRIVTLSIVGIDGLGGEPFGHYDGKRAQEVATETGPVATSILRATQFHGFAGQLIDWMAKGPIMPVTRQPSQTVDLDTVVRHLVGLADDSTTDTRVRRNLAGPERRMMTDLVRSTAKARRQRLMLVPVWLPGESAKKVRAGALQAPADAIIDGPRFDEWLSNEYTH